MIKRVSTRARRAFAGSLALALLISMLPMASVLAAPTTVTPATGGEAISADLAGSSNYTVLIGPSLAGSAGADFPSGSTIVLNVPAGFAFRPGFGSVTTSGPCTGLVLVQPTVNATTATATITTGPSSACTLTFVGLQVQPTAGTPLATGNITNSGTVLPNGAFNYGTLTEVAGAPVLTFMTQPSVNNTAAAPFGTQPVVHSQDQFLNARQNDLISLTITPGTGVAGAVLTCNSNTVATNASGNASFAGCEIDKAATGYRLRAATGMTFFDSATLNVAVGPADHLGFTSYPASSTPSILAPQPTVAVLDEGGNVVNDTRTITLSINKNSGTFTCTGGLSKAAVAGVAAFTGCTQTVVDTNYTLTASDGPAGLANVTGAAFSVTGGVANKLAICWGPTACNATPPSPITGGTAFSAQPRVIVQDAAGNTVVGDNTTVVTLSIAPSTPTSGGPGVLTCTGGLSKVVTAGVATFAGCSIDKPGTGYRLQATSSPPLTAALSNPFNVVVGPPARLIFVTPLGNAPAGTAFPVNPQVAIADAGGNIVTSGISATIALSIGANPASGTLTCTGGNTATTVNGVATFTGCSINNAGVGYTLIATATSSSPVTPLAPATSNAFTITVAPANITVTPSRTVITWGDAVLITVQFASNGSGKTVTLQGARDGVNFANIINLTMDASGRATFSYTPITNLYYRAQFVGTVDLGAAISPLVRVVVRQQAFLRPTNLGRVKQVNQGRQITFTTLVRPARPELVLPTVTFRVFQKIGATYQLVLTRTVNTNSSGLASLAVTFSSRGQFYVRSIANPTPYNANSVWSPLEFYRVV